MYDVNVCKQETSLFLSILRFLGYYFSVWLSVLNKTFMLSYMKRQHYVKELLEEEVLYEVLTLTLYLYN